jgi:hypothetical protein
LEIEFLALETLHHSAPAAAETSGKQIRQWGRDSAIRYWWTWAFWKAWIYG